MSSLLRRLGGFEGLPAVEKHLDSRQSPVASPIHIEDLEVHLDSAFPTPTSMPRHEHGHLVVNVDDLDEVHSEVVPLLGPVIQSLGDCVPALIRLGVGNLRGLDQHQVRRGHPIKHGQVAALHSFESETDQANPLLRHRPISIRCNPLGDNPKVFGQRQDRWVARWGRASGSDS